MTLRQKVIEAGARAMYEADDAYDLPWDEEIDEVKEWYRRMSAIQTDAMLDCLTENADEWFELWTSDMGTDGDPRFVDLLAVLREDR